MPNVGGVEYPYTPEGVAAAQEHARQLQKTGPYIPQPTVGLDPARMSPPLTSPSHPMAQRQTQDLQPHRLWRNSPQSMLYEGDPSFYGTQRQVPDLQPAPTWMSDRNAWRGAASRSPSAPDATAPTYEDRYTIQNDPNRYYGGTTRVGGSPIRGRTYAESPSNPMAQRPTPDLQRYNDPPIQGTMSGQGILGTLGYSNEAMPSRQDLSNVVAYGDSGLRYGDNRIAFSRPQLLGGPSSPWYQPVAPTPRGNVVETYGSGDYGSSPSNPNWGDTGGRSIQKSGPLPVSTRTQAINPQDRINANIRAVMSGQQGPRPGTSPTGQAPARPPSYKPWQNQFGPTGQPMAQRVPAQKMVDNVVRQLPGG